MKYGFLLFPMLFFWGAISCMAQNVSINDNGALPNAFSVLDVDASANDKGILIPRLTSAQRMAIIGLGASEEGLTVYDETLKSFFFWDGSVWEEFAHVDNAWSLGGNTGTLSGTNFIGTLDAQSIDFRTNNVLRARITQKGQLELLNTGNSVFLGEGAGANDDLSSNFNVFAGYQSGYTNTSGYDNAGYGYQALYSNANGAYNNAFGYRSMYLTSSGNYNTAQGTMSLHQNTTGSGNTAIGYVALYNNVANSRTTAVGYYAMNYADNRSTGRETYNTAIGYEALRGSSTPSNNTGQYNTAVGDQGLFSNTVGTYNNAFGYQALYANTSGNYNASYGNQSLFFNTTGSSNTAIGYAALYRNVAGNRSTAVGYYAMFYADNTASSKNTNNTAVGYEALQGSTNPGNNTGYNNTAMGAQALRSITSGYSNTAVGYQALYSNNSGVYNSGYGYQSCYLNTTGNNNTAYGFSTMYANTTGSSNTALGYQALHNNVANNNSTAVGYHAMFYADNRVIGSNTNNTAIGYEALMGSLNPMNNTGTGNTVVGALSMHSNTSGENNTSLGTGSLQNNTSGFSNTAIGNLAGDEITTGSYITLVGYNASADDATRTNCIGIAGNGNLAFGSDNSVRIGNASMTSIGGQVDWTTVSDKRIKENIKDNAPGLDFILELEPVTYTYNLTYENELMGITETSVIGRESLLRNSQIRHTGFLAQDVDQIVRFGGYEFDGIDKPEDENGLWGIRYATFVVPLVKAVQEQQVQIENLNTIINEQNKRIDALIQRIDNLEK